MRFNSVCCWNFTSCIQENQLNSNIAAKELNQDLKLIMNLEKLAMSLKTTFCEDTKDPFHSI